MLPRTAEEAHALDIPGLALVKPLPGAVHEGRGQQCSLIAATRGLRQAAVLELGPLLPYAAGDEAEVVVKNPCSFPIEFYSLEFDQQYLVEEKVSTD